MSVLDIISKRGEMAETTLADRILQDFSIVAIKKTSVKVPKLPLKSGNNKRFINKKNFSAQKNSFIPISSIVNILIKSAIEKSKTGKKEIKADEGKSYKVIKETFELNSGGGYGTSSKGYGAAPSSSYVDYGKLFSYLGKLKSKNAYQSNENHVVALNNSLESGSFALIDREAMENGSRFVRYMKHPTIDLNMSSLVPIGGMSSSEWEQFKLWKMIDPTMYLLKTSTS